MKAGWRTVKIGEILDKTENIDPTSFPEREYDYIDVSSVSNKSFSVEETQRIKGKDAPSRARKLVRTNDVLFATIRPTLQRIAIIPSRLDGQICSTGYFVLRPNEVISSRFIYYALMTDSFRSQMERLQKGASYPAVTDGDVRDQEIPLPPLAEQKRIVALLDEAFAGIDEAKAKSEANLDSSSGLFDMVREDLMREPDANTPSCSFDEICKIDSALVDPRENEYAEKLHVGGANIESKTGRLVALQTARQEGLKSGKFPFQKGMVLYSKIRPNLMKVARPDFEGLCSADMYPLAPVDGRVCRDYLYHLLLTERFTRFALLGSERAGMPKVNRDYLSRFTTKLPSISEQQAFASKLDALEQSLLALRELLTKKMAALQELKSSLLTQAFAGELTA